VWALEPDCTWKRRENSLSGIEPWSFKQYPVSSIYFREHFWNF